MNGALSIAWTTLRRARVVRVAGGIGALAPAMIAFVFSAATGSDSGSPAGAKLEALVAERTWSALIGASAQITSIGLLLAGGVVAAWWFGRDFESGMFETLFARAVSRVAIAAARLALLTAAGAATIIVALAATLAAGSTLRLERTHDILSSAGTFVARRSAHARAPPLRGASCKRVP